jgi:peroxiredoxin
MDITALSGLTLEDSTGAPRRLGDYWAARPVVLVFLRHFGCLLCREHAAQVRDHYPEIRGLDAEVVAIGTGDRRYAERFVADEHIPFPVLVDDHADAANAAAVRKVAFLRLLFNPASWPGTVRARRAGHRIHTAGKRVTQLGATVVVGPGEWVRYEHIDEHSADHAPLDDVFAVLDAR